MIENDVILTIDTVIVVIMLIAIAIFVSRL